MWYTISMIHIHLCISGFTQSVGRWNGILALQEKLLDELDSCGGHGCRVWYTRWKDNWKDIAEHIWLLHERNGEKVKVNVYAYSWGAGWGAMQLLKHLDKSNLGVEDMVLSDAVFRHPMISLRWLAMTPWAEIQCPINVQRLHIFYQRKNKPSGHKVAYDALQTQMRSRIELNYTHQKMDDAPEFHKTCLRIAKDAEVKRILARNADPTFNSS